LNNIAENLRVESQKSTLKLERITAEQENKMKEIQVTATRLEDMLKLLDVSFVIKKGRVCEKKALMSCMIETHVFSIHYNAQENE
jgi:hypothetical protein